MSMDRKIKAIVYNELIKIGNNYWFIYKDAIYSFDYTKMKITREKEIELPNAYLDLFCFMATIDEKIILSPFQTNNIGIYNLKTKNFNFLNLGNENLWFRNVIAYKNKVFILPGAMNNRILVLNNLDSIKYISIEGWRVNVKKYESTSEYAIQDKYLWVTAHYSNLVLKLNMETEHYEFIEIGENIYGYTGITLDGEYIWLAESNKGALIKYNIDNGNMTKYDAPNNLCYDSSIKSYVHFKIFNFKNYIISIPALCNQMTILDKRKEKIEIVDTDFFDSIIKNDNGNKNINYPRCSFGNKIDERTLWIQRNIDGEIACIDIEDFSYKIFSLEIDKKYISDIYTKLYRNEKMILENKFNVLNSLTCYLSCINRSMLKKNTDIIGRIIWSEM